MTHANQELINCIQNKNIHAVVREVSNGGNTRCVDFLIIEGDRLQTISHLIAPVLNIKQSSKHFGLIVKGCGMDMVFSCLYDLHRALGLNAANVQYSLV